MDVINIGNQTPKSAINLLKEIGVKEAKVRGCIGLWNGEMEDAVEVTVYDMSTPKFLDLLSKKLPNEEAFAVNEMKWNNPRWKS